MKEELTDLATGLILRVFTILAYAGAVALLAWIVFPREILDLSLVEWYRVSFVAQSVAFGALLLNESLDAIHRAEQVSRAKKGLS